VAEGNANFAGRKRFSTALLVALLAVAGPVTGILWWAEASTIRPANLAHSPTLFPLPRDMLSMLDALDASSRGSQSQEPPALNRPLLDPAGRRSAAPFPPVSAS
jgi:hypothetical protein